MKELKKIEPKKIEPKKLDADKVISWLRKNLAYWCELSRRSLLVDAVKQLKKDFEI